MRYISYIRYLKKLLNIFLQLFENLGNFNKKEMNLKNFEGNFKRKYIFTTIDLQ